MNHGKKKFTALLLCFALVFSMFFSPEQSVAKSKKIKLNKKKVTLYVGKSVRLKVKGTKQKAKWKSSKKKVATVSSKGKVKAKKKGKARITAKIGKKKLTCKVTVKPKKDAGTVQPGTSGGTQSTKPGDTSGNNETPGGGTSDGSGMSGASGSPSGDKTATPTVGSTDGSTVTATPTPTNGSTATPTPTPTNGSTATPTPTPTNVSTVTATPTPTQTAKVTNTPSSDSPKVPAVSQESSFENGTDGFLAYGDANVHSAQGGHSGNCLAVEDRKSSSSGALYSMTGKLTAGESYTVQGYVKSAANTATMKCIFQYGDTTQSRQEFISVQAAGQWKKFRGTFTVPANFTKADICFEMSGTGSFYIDEISIKEIVSIKGTYDSLFGKMGTCINPDQLRDPAVLSYVKKHYTSVTLENDMKPDYILSSWLPLIDTSTARTKTGDYVIPAGYKETKIPTLNYSTIDEVLRIAKNNGLKIRYHVLVWHAQSPEWFFRKDYSKDDGASYVSADVMNARLEMYIRSVIHHVYTLDGGAYKDVVYAWDVANEYFSNTPNKNWSAVYGNREGNLENKPPFIKKAFEIAHDALAEFNLQDSVSLFYNDFNTYLTTDKIIEMINYVNTDKKVCDGIGMQSHLGVNFPSVDSYVNTVKRFIAQGFEVQITELDVGCNSTTLETDAEAAYEEQAAYVSDMTKKLVAIQQESNHGITGMTWWGMFDKRSWRKEDVLMFGTGLYDAKPSYFAFIEAAGAVEKPAPTATPTVTPIPQTPTPIPKYTPPAVTAPPQVGYDFTDGSTYRNESPNGASHVVNADGSITITFTGQYAAFDFFLPDNAQNYYSNYKSVVLTYNSKGGNLSHALYDINMQGMDGDASAGKHPDWSQKIKESPNGDTTLIFNVTDECVGGCIRGFQIFNQNQMAAGQSITITVKSLKFYDTINPSIDPTPAQGQLDLSDYSWGPETGSAYNDGKLILDGITSIGIRLPFGVKNGEKVKVTLRGSLSSDMGFRSWLVDEAQGTHSNQVESVKASEVKDWSDFEWSYELTADIDLAEGRTFLLIKARTSWEEIKGLTITFASAVKEGEEASPTATPTPEPGGKDSFVELSQANEYGKGAIEPQNVQYDANGATFTGLTSNSGGGVIWWAKKDCSALNLGDYEKIVFRVTVDHIPEGLGSVPVVLAATKSKDPQFWNVPSIPSYTSITNANTPVELEFNLDSISKGDNPEDRNADIYGIMLKYNAWVKEGETFKGDDVTFTIHSITLVGKDS